MRTSRLLLIVPTLVACYRYEPLPTPAPVVGAEFRSHLTSQGSETLAPTLGRNIGAFDGRLLAEEGEQFRFSISQTQTREARLVSWSGETVTLPRATIARMEMKVLDKPKTYRAVALGVVGAIIGGLLFSKIQSQFSGSGPTGGGPTPP
ncbi:MAG: hypothetical protein ACT4OZ_15575 [Gemmatimonadota bacterium]